ncbi:MAG: helix-turn-helix domain-containing protein, partial [Myxococcota bacterium]
ENRPRCAEDFVDDGPAASTSKVADLLGVSQAALFRRFGSKERLLIEALAPPQTPAWVAALSDGPDHRPLAEQLIEIAETAAVYLREHVPRLSALTASGVRHEAIFAHYEDGPPVLGALRAITAWFERARRLKLIDEDTDPQSAAVLFMGAVQFPAFLNHLPIPAKRRPLGPKTLTKTVALFARGLERQ